MSACTSTSQNSSNNEPETVDKTTPVHRTILVYMAANNSLGQSTVNSEGLTVRCDTLDIYEMRQAAKNGDLNGGRLILYHADVHGTAKLYEVTASGLKELKNYEGDGLTSVHASRMKTVIADTKEAAPAKDYGLVLWSHGDGWLQDGIDEEETTATQAAPHKAFGLETASSKKMNISTLASVLDGQGFSFIYFDCCYMASVEVEYELRNVTNYIVGSVTELPVDGMPYDQNLRCLFATNADLVGAAKNTFNYYNNKTDDWQTCTMSVVRTAYLDNLAAATKNIYAKATTSLPDGYYPQRFVVSGQQYYYDLDNYVQALASEADYISWQTALSNCVMYNASTPYLWPHSAYQLALRYVCGLSTYIMTSESDAVATKRKYQTLSWYNDVVSKLFE